VSGVAGSGKSFTVSLAIKEIFYRHGAGYAEVLSTTKSAANNVSGQTISSFLKLGNLFSLWCRCISHFYFPILFLGKRGLDDVKESSITNQDILEFRAQHPHLRELYIDECGLLNCLAFDNLDKILRKYCDGNRPFGGLRIVLIGDVMQLPPIKSRFAGNGDNRLFFFQSDRFCRDPSAPFFVFYLDEVQRQKDKDLIDLLNRIRIGEHTQADLDRINSTCGKRISKTIVAKLKECLRGLLNSQLNSPCAKTREKLDKKLRYYDAC
jgi:hypothetical protein